MNGRYRVGTVDSVPSLLLRLVSSTKSVDLPIFLNLNTFLINIWISIALKIKSCLQITCKGYKIILSKNQ